VENQENAFRVGQLARVPAEVRFLSCEPLLGALDLFPYVGRERVTIDWLIAGGESGKGFRAPDPAWIHSLRDQCAAAGVPFLFKQWGGLTPKSGGRLLDGVQHDGYPTHPNVQEWMKARAEVEEKKRERRARRVV
jgi:protein gp37